MSVSARYSLAVWQRNATMYSRTWKWNILPNFFEPVFYLAAVGIGVGAYIQEMGGVSYVAFLAPGLVAVSAMNGASSPSWSSVTSSAPGQSQSKSSTDHCSR